MRSNKKTLFIVIGIITIIIFTCLIVNNIFLKEENKTKIIKQNNTIGIIVEGQEQEEFPSKQDYEFEKAVCNGEEVPSTDIGTDSFNINISGISATSNCVFYFIEAFEYTETFTYISTEPTKIWNAPKAGTYKIELWGAKGSNKANYIGGAGAYTSGNIDLILNDILYFYIGSSPLGDLGGYNGGGYDIVANKNYFGEGGGATDVRLQNGLWDDLTSIKTRIMIAAGGGGADNRNYDSTIYSSGNGGAGGGLIGNLGTYTKLSSVCGTSTAPTQTEHGECGVGAWCANGFSGYCNSSSNSKIYNQKTLGNATYANHGSGPGGGYYVGNNTAHMGAPGGSSYISGHIGCVAITLDGTAKSGCTTGINDQLCSVHYSGKVFANTKMIDGSGLSWTNVVGTAEAMPNPLGGNYPLNTGHIGNGYVRITYIR